MRSALAVLSLLSLTASAAAPLTIEQALELARTRNERAQVAKWQATAAQARVDRARSFFLPELSLIGRYTRRLHETRRTIAGESVVTQAQNRLDAFASLRMTLLDPRGFPLYAAAKHDAEAERLNASEAQRLLAFETGQVFVNALSLAHVEDAASRRLELARHNLREAQARFEAQLVSSNDVTQARLEVATANRARVRAQADRAAAVLMLGFLTGSEIDGLASPDVLLAEAVAARPGPQELEAAQRERIDLRALKARADALEAQAVEPLMRLLPALNFAGQYQVTNDPGIIGRNADGFAALELGWTLFDGGERYAERRERLAQAKAARLNAEALSRGLGAELKTAAVALDAARAALDEAQVAFEAAEQNAKERSILYQQGLSSALELANANVLRFDAQVALARERFALALALFDLRAAQGLGPLGAPWPLEGGAG